VRKLAPPIERDADDARLLAQVVDYYHETLKQSPDAQAYLIKRGLVHPEMIQRFKIGFANRTLGYRLPQSNRVAGSELRGRLQKLGIYRESGHEHFNGCIVIPIFSRAGEVVQIYGRKLSELSQPLHLYLPGPHRGVFNEETVQASKEIIL
jgi:DNA primase